MSTVRVEGVPLTGELVNYGFGGVRRWALLLAVGSLAYGAYLLTRRSALTVRRAEALARLGIGLAVLAGLWVMTLILFLESSLDRVGPGPWVTLAGGVLVWLAARGQLTAPAGAAPAEWPRRSAAWDLAVVVVAELLAYLAFLVGIGIDDAGEFLGFFVALTAAAATLSSLGVLKGLTGPFRRVTSAAVALLALLLLAFPFTQSGNTFWIQVTAQAGLFVLAALGLNIVVGLSLIHI